MYDAYSVRLLHSTDWRRLGALWNPGPTVRQWGAPPNEVELAALGRARLAASTQVNAADIFWQHHPLDQSAFILCAARVSSVEPGWEIVLLDEEQRPFWHLKADRGAELHCVDHCGGWQPGCRGVVSVPSGGRREPPAPPPMVGMAEPSPSPRPAPATPTWRDRRRERVARHMGWAQPAATVAASQEAAAEPQQAVAVPEGWRWPASSAPVEADRGEIHAHHEQTETPPAWPAQYHLDHAELQPAPAVEAPAAPAARRGFFASLFAGGAVAAAAPAVVEQAASAVPSTWVWPEPAGEEYRGELHEPQPLAIEQQWQWPDALPGAAVESPPAIEHYPGAWNAPALTAPAGVTMGWDTQEAESSGPWPSYEALPASEPETPQLSSQAEIDTFIDAAWRPAPAVETEAAPGFCPPALPPPEPEQ